MIICPTGPDVGVSVREMTLKAAEATIELEPEYTITKSFPAAVPLGSVTVPEVIVPEALEVKLPVEPLMQLAVEV